LDFPRLSKGWNGGVAGIVPEARSRVEGVVYGLSREDLAKLDILEGVPKSRYVRCRVEVVTAGGAPEQVWTYFAVPEDGWPFRPSRRYLETILTGAREHRLSSAYVDYLEKLSAESVASPT
jgi:hypothetical protein